MCVFEYLAEPLEGLKGTLGFPRFLAGKHCCHFRITSKFWNTTEDVRNPDKQELGLGPLLVSYNRTSEIWTLDWIV